MTLWKVFGSGVNSLWFYSLFGRVGELVFSLPIVTFLDPWILPQALDGIHIWLC